MAFRQVFVCDRKSCKNTTPGLSLFNDAGQDIFAYEDTSWLGVRISKEEHLDFCSWECLGMYVDEKMKQVRG